MCYFLTIKIQVVGVPVFRIGFAFEPLQVERTRNDVFMGCFFKRIVAVGLDEFEDGAHCFWGVRICGIMNDVERVIVLGLHVQDLAVYGVTSLQSFVLHQEGIPVKHDGPFSGIVTDGLCNFAVAQMFFVSIHFNFALVQGAKHLSAEIATGIVFQNFIVAGKVPAAISVTFKETQFCHIFVELNNENRKRLPVFVISIASLAPISKFHFWETQ